MEDVIVCGGGPAGLAAATWLGRYRRKSVVFDAGRQRNLATDAAHGYLGHDYIAPQDLLQLARKDLQRYDTVQVLDRVVDRVERTKDGFGVEAAGERFSCHRLILGTGVEDVLPDIPGLADLYGTSIFHCPSCDGYEARDRRVVAIGWGEQMAGFALDLLDWGASVDLVTAGYPFEGDDACHTALLRHDVELIEEKVAEFVGKEGRLTEVRLASGRTIPADIAFFSIEHRPRTDLARQLGCELEDTGRVQVDRDCKTSVEGVWAVGDVTPGEQLIQVAAAQGAIAGIDCAMSLRGMKTRSPAPAPGPDPEQELDGS